MVEHTMLTDIRVGHGQFLRLGELVKMDCSSFNSGLAMGDRWLSIHSMAMALQGALEIRHQTKLRTRFLSTRFSSVTYRSSRSRRTFLRTTSSTESISHR